MEHWKTLRWALTRDIVILFRIGDFYELYHEDAARVAPVLGLPLNDQKGVPTVRIPVPDALEQVGKLADAGIRMAVEEYIPETFTAFNP